jgi:transposase IS116/IS110/IS902 family protein
MQWQSVERTSKKHYNQNMPTPTPTDDEVDLGLDPVQRLTRDLRTAAKTLSHAEARYLVDAYYQMQRDRIRSVNQVRATGEATEPNAVLSWLAGNTRILEDNVRRALDAYTDGHPVGLWSKTIVGIGPVIAAGLLAHIDIERAPTVGHIWSFAGLNPQAKWLKGQKRPWNARLKTLCWKIGESFVKQSSREGDFYGKLYAQRKAFEQAQNEAGAYAEQATISLREKRFGEDTKARAAYEAGQLPPARIHLRSQRWAVKIFLAHWHHVAFETRFGQPPPKPYVLSILGHADEIRVPNWP